MEYKNAPIAEVVIGMQFDGKVFDNPYIYNFYQDYKGQFPIIKENPALPSVIERIEGGAENKILQGFESRKFFINGNNSKLIQLQPDRLLFNWKRTTEQLEYPHFHAVLEEFMNIYTRLDADCDLDTKITQVEITYLDHIVLDNFQKTDFNPNGILDIIAFNEETNINHLKFEIGIPKEELSGNIKVNITSALRNQDKGKVLVMENTCRGALGKLKKEEWFKKAHNELIDLFDSITSDNAKKVWGVQK